jgi:hypothetical protein
VGILILVILVNLTDASHPGDKEIAWKFSK